MSKRPKIRESFFNPILIFFHVLTFLLLDTWTNENWALIGFVLSIIISVVYVAWLYPNLIKWYLFFTVVSVFFVVFILIFRRTFPTDLFFVADDIVCFFGGLLLFLSKNTFEKKSKKEVSRQIPMSNNLQETYQTARLLLAIIGLLLILYFIIKWFFPKNDYLLIFNLTYTILITALVVYETVRVFVVRSKLNQEVWLPIVNEQGKIIGSIQQTESLLSEEKFMHPIARTLLVKDDKIYLHKPIQDGFTNSDLWDTALSVRVQTNETMEDAVQRGLRDFYRLDQNNFVFISGYISESDYEKKYIYLYLNCCLCDIKPNLQHVGHGKWWTLKQIEENLNANIFTKEFMVEYDTLKRIGFFEKKICECNCRLKETIYSMMDKMPRKEN